MIPPSFLENSFQCRSSKTARHAIFPQNGSEKTRNEDMPFFLKMDQKRLKIKKKTPCLFGREKKFKEFWVYLPPYQKFYRLIVFLKITRRETTTLSTTLYPMQERRPAENGWNKGCLHFEHHTCVPSFPLVWSYLEMTRLGKPTLFPFEESLRKERLWLNVSCLIRKCHGLKYTNISSSLLLKSNERVHLGCFKSDTLWRKKIAMPVKSPPGHI